jgi:hypothetical protein
VPGWTDDLQVFCADVGSLAQGNFAWAARLPADDAEDERDPFSIDSLAAVVVYQLAEQRPAALGFEAPIFIPVPDDSARLGKARPCDKKAPAWSSGPGGSVMATGIAQMAWLLRTVREAVPGTRVHLGWESFAQAQAGLLVWEAFVTRDAKGATHEEDARIGVEAFCAQLPSPGDDNANDTEQPLSLAAAAALWAGWDVPAAMLNSPCVLVRAT